MNAWQPVKVWHSKNEGPWVEIAIRPTSIAGVMTARSPGEIYDDGYGNRYCSEKPAESTS